MTLHWEISLHYQVASAASYFLCLFLSAEPFASLAVHVLLCLSSLQAVQPVLQVYFMRGFFNSTGESQKRKTIKM